MMARTFPDLDKGLRKPLELPAGRHQASAVALADEQLTADFFLQRSNSPTSGCHEVVTRL